MRIQHPTLKQFHRIHQNQTGLVLGCGPSIQQLENQDSSLLSIGVNYGSRWYVPNYQVIVDRINSAELSHWMRRYIIEECTASYLFAPYPVPNMHPTWVPIRVCALHQMDIQQIFKRQALFVYYTSTLTALALALYMGFTRIGILGFDLYNHPILEPYAHSINQMCYRILDYARERGIELTNLSPASLITAFPTWELKDFLACT